MRVVVAPDKFKDCLEAQQAADLIRLGVLDACPDAEVVLCPMADGGEGTVAALVEAVGGSIVTKPVTGPLPGMRVDARIGLIDDGKVAVIEMSSAAGLALLRDDQRNPMRTTTYGVGELIRYASLMDVESIILGIGGSATVDGGIGMLQAWGANITLQTGRSYGRNDRKLTGADVGSILRIDVPPAPKKQQAIVRRVKPAGVIDDTDASESDADQLPPANRPQIIVACDVGNPLYGESGAAYVFGPQKGATPEQCKELDIGLQRLASRSGKPKLAGAPGAGAAGGIGFALNAFMDAEMKSGVEIVIETVRLRPALYGADVCFTAEGRLDHQTAAGKTIAGVAQACKEANVPCIALAGSVDPSVENMIGGGLSAYFSICNRPMPLNEAIESAAALLRASTANVMRVWMARK